MNRHCRRRNDLFKPHYVVWFQRTAYIYSDWQVPTRVPLNRDLHLVTHRRPDLLDRFKAAFEVIRIQVVTDRSHRADAGALTNRTA